MSAGFQFKQFFIAHDRCAMKVNTDGILLGAIANITHAQNILDLGTGTGLIAIMLAQRTAEKASNIVAVELEQNAFEQAQQNISTCPWHQRITVLQADIMNIHFEQKFDLIVANPPYFSHSLPSRSSERDLARVATQSHFDWLAQASRFLTNQGQISFILPLEHALMLIEQSAQLSLFYIESWQIHTKQGKNAKRMIVTFSPQYQPQQQNQLVIYNEQNQYTASFKQLTQAFYLSG